MKSVFIVVGLFIVLVCIYAVFAQYHNWSKSYSIRVQGLQAENVWKVWTDINNWNTWQNDIEYAKIEGDFIVGNTFTLKPKDASEVTIELIEVANSSLKCNFTS